MTKTYQRKIEEIESDKSKFELSVGHNVILEECANKMNHKSRLLWDIRSNLREAKERKLRGLLRHDKVSRDITQDVSFRCKRSCSFFRFGKSRVESNLMDNKGGCDIEGFKEIDIKGDGNCFFRCISMFLYGHEENHRGIRERIVRRMNTNPEVYQALIDGDFNQHIQDQLSTSGDSTTWATEASSEFRCKLFILSSGERGQTWDCFDINYDKEGCKPNAGWIAISHRNNHFNLLIPDKKHCTCELHEPDTDWIKENVTNWFDMTTKKSSKYQGEPIYRQEVNRCNNVKTEINGSAGMGKGEVTQKEENNLIVNLSDKILTKPQQQLLSKGFSFVPTREKVDVTKLLSDLGEWERRMRLREYFFKGDEEGDAKYVEREPWKKKKSEFTLQVGRDRWLDMYIELAKNDVVEGINKRKEANITEEEQTAMKEIRPKNR
ncbi:hypothetical protein LOTGIDRAFT_174188 [Lottia gigantea]|uniref:OTU domain-containing protein n=1 Tax=Lottia gigantea TaxID=225164 RepID=V4A3R8_LOTGI|nr:hypothetical protein LOTGIDRAFT_174188 [Lottia gigantea]ESO98543.1 hypothetical protein LOTGIDRAFT_174188 [Lottia gigantea]